MESSRPDITQGYSMPSDRLPSTSNGSSFDQGPSASQSFRPTTPTEEDLKPQDLKTFRLEKRNDFVFPARPVSMSGPLLSMPGPSPRSHRRRPSSIAPSQPLTVGIGAYQISPSNPQSAPESSSSFPSPPSFAAMDRPRSQPTPLPQYTFNSTNMPQVGDNGMVTPPISPDTPVGTMFNSSRLPPAPYPIGHSQNIQHPAVEPSATIPLNWPKSHASTGNDASGRPQTSLPVPGRRGGHAHRRSAALSSHDLKSIMIPQPQALNIPMRSESAPTTPGEAPPRARAVAFSEDIDYISRPISMVSSGTEGSASAKDSAKLHSISSSVSSVTAERPVTAPSSPATEGLAELCRKDSNLARRKSEPLLYTTAKSESSPAVESPTEDPSLPASLDSKRSSKWTKNLKLLWAKEKGIKSKADKEGATQPASTAPKPAKETVFKEEFDQEPGPEFDLQHFEPNFDNDTSVTITDTSRAPSSGFMTSVSDWQPRTVPTREDFDAVSPILDLDAEYAKPSGRTDRSFAASRTRMHSGAPHRRAESAPALLPFDRSAFGNRNTMADVFEEEEGENDDIGSGVSSPVIRPTTASSATKPSISVSDADIPPVPQVVVASEPEQLAEPDKSNVGLGIQEPSGDIDVVRHDEDPRATSPHTELSDETVMPLEAYRGYSPAKQPPTEQMSYFSNESPFTPESIDSSTFSPPDTRQFFSTSSRPATTSSSLNTPRLGTSASSVTDYRDLTSPGVRLSQEDPPSLASSHGTAEGLAAPPRFLGERSGSVASQPSPLAADTKSKRSSIGSLRQLLRQGSSSSSLAKELERPKTAVEAGPVEGKKRKQNRLSRLTHRLFKSKESLREGK